MQEQIASPRLRLDPTSNKPHREIFVDKHFCQSNLPCFGNYLRQRMKKVGHPKQLIYFEDRVASCDFGVAEFPPFLGQAEFGTGAAKTSSTTCR